MSNLHQLSEEWLEQSSKNDFLVTDAIKSDLRNSISKIKSESEDLYGYAILPGDIFEVGSLVAAYNKLSDLKNAKLASQTYYKYSVDEWLNYDHNVFESSNILLQNRTQAFRQFCELHEDEDLTEVEIKFAESIYRLVLKAFSEFRQYYSIENSELFLAIWVSDSANSILEQSVLELNSKAVSQEFCGEFCAK